MLVYMPTEGHAGGEALSANGAFAFASRQAYRLAYPCQREPAHDRASRRAFKLRGKLGAEGGIGDYVPKPKWMRWQTYDRKLEELLAAEEVVDAFLLGFVQKVDRRLRRWGCRFAWQDGWHPAQSVTACATRCGTGYLAAMILMTQRHDEMATRREQITLELAILSEQKSAKIIALLEEFRRNDPHQGNDRDEVAEALAEPTDGQVVLDAIQAAENAERS
jgi:hypothetical protein